MLALFTRLCIPFLAHSSQTPTGFFFIFSPFFLECVNRLGQFKKFFSCWRFLCSLSAAWVFWWILECSWSPNKNFTIHMKTFYFFLSMVQNPRKNHCVNSVSDMLPPGNIERNMPVWPNKVASSFVNFWDYPIKRLWQKSYHEFSWNDKLLVLW